MEKKFIKVLNKGYESVLTEQGPLQPEMMGAPAPSPAPPPPPPAGGAAPPQVEPGGEGASLASQESKESRSNSDTFLIGLVAKALLINIDDDDKLKIIKFLKKLNEDSASEIEESLVNIINSYDYQNLDEDLDSDFKIPSKKSRKVIKLLTKIMDSYVDTETD